MRKMNNDDVISKEAYIRFDYSELEPLRTAKNKLGRRGGTQLTLPHRDRTT